MEPFDRSIINTRHSLYRAANLMCELDDHNCFFSYNGKLIRYGNFRSVAVVLVDNALLVHL